MGVSEAVAATATGETGREVVFAAGDGGIGRDGGRISGVSGDIFEKSAVVHDGVVVGEVE